MIQKIISGGQTGVDQAALDAAICCGIPYGGWLPAGRKTENGPLAAKYAMDELASPSYPDRTRKNVEASDATLIISRGPLTGGSKLTENIALACRKPCLHVNLNANNVELAVVEVHSWLKKHAPVVVNVAGPRASSDWAIYDDAYALLLAVLQKGLHARNKSTL